jgi:hypothetical protein
MKLPFRPLPLSLAIASLNSQSESGEITTAALKEKLIFISSKIRKCRQLCSSSSSAMTACRPAGSNSPANTFIQNAHGGGMLCGLQKPALSQSRQD